MSKTSKAVFVDVKPKRKLALLFPAHNEELILAQTIESAIRAGQPKEDIYIVDDASKDATRKIALQNQAKSNVLTVRRSGKALAVKKAIKKFKIEKNYEWLHIADADSIFSADYFRIYTAGLDSSKYAVALGFVQSLKGNWLCTYRSLTYTYSQHIFRRLQSMLRMISVFPGPITSFRTDIIKDLDFESNSLTEDFDITIQVHRKKLGRVKFMPQAVSYTQDPQTFKEFWKQNARWQRGFFQGVTKYGIGKKAQLLDMGIAFQVADTIIYLVHFFILLPIVSFMIHDWRVMPFALLGDYLFVCVLVLFSIIATKRISLIKALPVYYFLRWTELLIFIVSFVEVVILKKFRSKVIGWNSGDKRYAISKSALKETAVSA